MPQVLDIASLIYFKCLGGGGGELLLNCWNRLFDARRLVGAVFVLLQKPHTQQLLGFLISPSINDEQPSKLQRPDGIKNP